MSQISAAANGRIDDYHLSRSNIKGQQTRLLKERAFSFHSKKRMFCCSDIVVV